MVSKAEVDGLEMVLKGKMLLDPDYIKENLAEFTSDKKIKEYLGYEVKIRTYSELKDIYSIDCLIPSANGACILLIESAPNTGHWVVLLKYNNVVEFFNSYGDPPAHEVSIIPDKINKVLNQSPRDILNILDNEYDEGKEVIYNRERLQKVSGDIGTCGKHCILRSFMLQNYGMGLVEYLSFIDSMTSEVGVDADGLVTLLVDVP